MKLRQLTPLVLFAMAAHTAFAATLTLNPTADNHIRNGNSGPSLTQNYGGNIEMLAGTVGASDFARTLLAFDLSSPLLTGATINSVSLTFTTTTTDTGSTSATVGYSLYQLTQTFTEGSGTVASPSTDDSTWANRTTGTAWTTAGGTFNSTVLSSYSTNPNTLAAGSTVTFGSTSNFTSVVSSSIGASYFGLLLKQTTEGSVRELLRLASGENATSSNWPVLTIDYTAVPEPSTYAVLAGLGALGWAAARRRRI